MDFLYFIIIFTSLITGIYLSNKFGAQILQISSVNFVTWYYGIEFLLMSAISIFFITSVQKMHWALKIIPLEEFPLKEVALATSWCAIAIPTGFYFANFFLTKLKFKSDYNSYLSQSLKTSQDVDQFLKFGLFIISVITIYILQQLESIPQLDFIYKTKSLENLRGDITHNFQGNVYLMELFGKNFTPILTITAFINFLERKNIKNFIIYALLLLLFIFYATLSLTKSAQIFIILSHLIAVGLINKKLSFSKILLTFFITLASVLLLYQSYYPQMKIKNALKNILTRTMISQSCGNYFSFYLFPNKIPHIGFSSTSRLSEKLGIKYQENAARQMMRFAQPKKVESGIAGYMVSTFFAEAWANFGFFGILLSPLYVGFFIKFLIGILMNLEKTPLTIGIISFVSYNLGVNQGFNQILFPRYLLLTLFILLGPTLYQSLRKCRNVKKPY